MSPMIRRLAPVAPLAALAVLAPSGPADARARSVEEAKAAAPPLELEERTPERFTLKNGIPVWYLRDTRLPLVTVRVVVRAGAVWEGKPGAAELTGAMLRRGGSERLGPDAVDEELDFLAARLSASIGGDQGSVTLDVLEENLEPALAILGDLVRRPAFAESKLGVQKNLLKEEIRRQNDSPIQAGLREYRKLVWGADHPRARTPTEASVDALGREDLAAFHARFFRPSGIMIGVAGSASRKDVKKLLEKAFGDWDAAAAELPALPTPAPVEARVALAPKKVPQTTVILGHLGPRETDPERAAAQVMMNILGSGGFTSYITDRIRNDEGLAYFAGGFLQFGRMDPGLVITIALSKSATTCRAADLVVEQIERIRENEPTAEELVRARDGILNSRAFDFDSPGEIVANLMDLAYYGLPEDHDRRVIDDIGKVTAADVRTAARAVLAPERLTWIAVGDPDAMDCDWARYAERAGVPLTRIELE